MMKCILAKYILLLLTIICLCGPVTAHNSIDNGLPLPNEYIILPGMLASEPPTNRHQIIVGYIYIPYSDDDAITFSNFRTGEQMQVTAIDCEDGLKEYQFDLANLKQGWKTGDRVTISHNNDYVGFNLDKSNRKVQVDLNTPEDYSPIIIVGALLMVASGGLYYYKKSSKGRDKILDEKDNNNEEDNINKDSMYSRNMNNDNDNDNVDNNNENNIDNKGDKNKMEIDQVMVAIAGIMGIEVMLIGAAALNGTTVDIGTISAGIAAIAGLAGFKGYTERRI